MLKIVFVIKKRFFTFDTMTHNLPPALMAKMDQMFMNMTQEAGGLNPFLDSLFSFLQRRTDFYYEAEPGDNMGFPPQYNEQMVSEHAFRADFIFRGSGEFVLNKHAFASLTKKKVIAHL